MAAPGFLAGETLPASQLKLQTVHICTSSTRPASPFEGLTIFETNTDRYLTWDGAAWIRTGWASANGRTGCVLRRAAAQSINSAAVTAISWDTEDVDTDGFITVTSSTITIPAGLTGIYGYLIALVQAAGVPVRTFIQVAAGGNTFRHTGGTEDVVAAGGTLRLTAAGTFVVSVFHTTGSAQNWSGRMELWRIGP